VLDLLHARLVEGIAKRRKLPAERVQALIDDGPHGAHEARVAGLVDDVGFDDEARAHAKKAANATSTRRARLGPEGPQSGFDFIARALFGDEEEPSRKPRIVLAYLDGMILEGGSQRGSSASATPFVRAMRRFSNDENVRALVLRIDSPGGSAAASDRMWHAVRRVAKRKPVIVSVGDMAASGGYYVATAGDEIFARDTSFVGSIGVIVGKPIVEDLAMLAGVRVERLTRGRNAGWSSFATRFSETERAAVERLARHTYRRFVQRVADGRGKKMDEIEPLAQGRLWTGASARESGLVDHEGGLWQALERAREQGELDEDAPIETWPEAKSLFEALAGVGASAPDDVLGSQTLPPLPPIVRAWLDGPVATVLPWTVELR
jgi:protease-4